MSYSEFMVKIGDYQTVIYKKGEGVVLSEATLIAFYKRGNKIDVIEIGDKAKKLISKNEPNFYVKSPLQNGVIVDFEIMKLLFKKFMSLVYKKKLSTSKVKVTFFLNCGLTIEERKQYEDLAINLGVFNYDFLCDIFVPYIYNNSSKLNSIMIVDIGSQTTQIAVIKDDEISLAYSIELGGNLLDNAIVKKVCDMFNVVIPYSIGEQIKRHIGGLLSTDVSNMTFCGFDALTKEKITNTIFSRDIYDLFKTFYDKIIEGVQIVLNQLDEVVVKDIMNCGIFLTGGQAKVSGIEQYFQNALNINTLLLDDYLIQFKFACDEFFKDKELYKKIVNNN